MVVFSRAQYKEPTEEQWTAYYADKEIVEQHGGRMIASEHAFAGENPTFTEAACAEMVAAVLKDLPDYELSSTWNGEGSYSFSVSIRPKPGGR